MGTEKKVYRPSKFFFAAYAFALGLGVATCWAVAPSPDFTLAIIALLAGGGFLATWWWLNSFATIEVSQTDVSGPQANRLFQRASIERQSIDFSQTQNRSALARVYQFYDIVSVDGTRVRVMFHLLGRRQTDEILQSLGIRLT